MKKKFYRNGGLKRLKAVTFALTLIVGLLGNGNYEGLKVYASWFTDTVEQFTAGGMAHETDHFTYQGNYMDVDGVTFPLTVTSKNGEYIYAVDLTIKYDENRSVQNWVTFPGPDDPVDISTAIKVTNGTDETSIASVAVNGHNISITGFTAGQNFRSIKILDENGQEDQFVPITVTYYSINATGITLNKSTSSLTVGSQETLSVSSASPDSASLNFYSTKQKATWSSSDETKATVDANGVVTAVAPGSVTITATANDDAATKATATCTYTVNSAVLVDYIYIYLPNGGFDPTLTTGDTMQLMLDVSPDNATNKNVIWTSDHPEILSVSTTGLLTAISAGRARITATAADGSGENRGIDFTVNAVPVTGVNLDRATLNLTVGETDTLTATVLPVGAANTGVTWSSNDTSVAMVYNEGSGHTAGTVQAIATGTAIITATSNADGTKLATCTVTVSESSSIPTPNPAPAPDPEPVYYYTPDPMPNPTPKPVSEIAKEVEATITDTTVKADDKVGVELTKTKAENFVEKTSEGGTAVKIELKNFTIELDKAALDTIAEGTKNANDVIIIKADEYDKSKLTKAQSAVVEEKKPELVFEAYVERNDEKVHDFNGGQATIGIRFTPANNPAHYFVEYISSKGKVERFPTWYEGGKLCFTTGHFSEYIVVYDENETNGKPAAYLTATKRMAVGSTFNLVSTVAEGKKLKFTSSDKSVAKVSKKGIITAKSVGKCIITAECEDYKFVLKVRVTDAPTGQLQTPGEVAWTDTTDNAVIAMYKRVNKGKRFKINVTGAEDAVITYEIEDENVAFVKKGKIVGKNTGKTIVDVHVKSGNVENVYRFFIRVR